MSKVVEFFKKIKPSKRKLIQLYAALLYNAQLKGFINGKIYTGKSKSICVPGMNCYSCPGAIGACPIGSLESSLSDSNTKAPTYVIGIILLYAITLGRTICGYLCPFGFLQELLYMIKTPKLKKNKVTRVLSYFKYILLIILVIMIPLIYGLQKFSIPLPGFCKFICPSGTFEGAVFLLANKNNSDYFGMLGPLFTWKFCLLIIFITASIFIFRFFCRFFCPLGALYGLFNKLSIIGIKVDKSKCNSCGACISKCKMDTKYVGDHECINCGECIDACHSCAISWKKIGPLVRRDIKASLNAVDTAVLDSNLNSQNSENQIEVKEEVSNADDKKVKTKKISNRKIINLVSFIIAIVVLIMTYIFVNVDNSKKFYSLNSKCDNFSIKLTLGNKYNTKDDKKKTIFYFYDNYNEDDFNSLNKFVDDDVNIVVISTFDNKENDLSYKETYGNFIYGYDSVNTTSLLAFQNKAVYPYLVALDNNDKVIFSQNTMLDDNQSFIFKSGGNVGVEVGNIIINYQATLIETNKIYSIYDHLGEIQVINFWYTDCPGCVKELRENIFEDAVINNDDVYCIAIHNGMLYDSNSDDFVKNNFPNSKIDYGYDDLNCTFYNSFFSGAYPGTIVVDKEGKIVLKKNGPFASSSELQEVIDACR